MLKPLEQDSKGIVAPSCLSGTYPKLDILLALDIGGDQHLVDHATLALAQAAADVPLGEALRLPWGLIRQGRCFANDHILTYHDSVQLVELKLS